jgi:hypothetical protein
MIFEEAGRQALGQQKTRWVVFKQKAPLRHFGHGALAFIVPH